MQTLTISADRWTDHWQFSRPQIDFRSPHYYIATFPLHSSGSSQVKASPSSPPLSEGDFPTQRPLHVLAVVYIVTGDADNLETTSADAVRIRNRFFVFVVDNDDAEFLNGEEEGGRRENGCGGSGILLREGAPRTGTIMLNPVPNSICVKNWGPFSKPLCHMKLSFIC